MMARRVPFLRRSTIAPHTDTRNASPAWQVGSGRVQPQGRAVSVLAPSLTTC